MKKTPRILQVCAVDFTVAHFLLPLIRFLENKNCEVVTACSRGPIFDSLVNRGLKMHAIEIRRSYDLTAHIRSIRELTDYLRREKFDVVHAHTPVAALIVRIAATRAQVPVRFYTAHGFYFHDQMNPLLYRLHVALERYGGKKCDFIFIQSEEDRLTAIRERIATPDSIRTIGNGIDLTRFSRSAVPESEREHLKAELAIRPQDQIVAIIGRVVAEKGYGELFEAMQIVRREVPTARLLVIGGTLPSDRGRGLALFSDRIEKLDDGVILAGGRTDIPALLSLADVYALPSWREGMPRSIIEAMAMELPVVATNIRGCREEVVEGETGRLVPVRNATQLAQALCDMLKDKAKSQTLGQSARKRAEQFYDEQTVLNRQWEVYQQFLA